MIDLYHGHTLNQAAQVTESAPQPERAAAGQEEPAASFPPPPNRSAMIAIVTVWLDSSAAKADVAKAAVELDKAMRQAEATRRSAEAREGRDAERNGLILRLYQEGKRSDVIAKHTDVVKLNRNQVMTPDNVRRIVRSGSTRRK
jgi:hypothetical protein